MTAELRQVAEHIGADPTCIHDWPGPGEITRHSWEPMPEAERQKWETDRLERHIQRLRGAR